MITDTKKRILAYLSTVSNLKKTLPHIQKKINKSYHHTSELLRDLRRDKLVNRFAPRGARKYVVYDITDEGRKVIMND